MQLSDLQRDALHHAYLITGKIGDLPALQDHIERLLTIRFAQNPDVFVRSGHAFQVEEARALVHHARGASLVQGAPKVLLVYFTSITRESQNILLKTLEEPSDNTYIFIVTPNVEGLLPTVLSRCLRLEREADADAVLSTSGEDFLQASLPERLKMIEKIVKGKDKNENKAQILEILTYVEHHLAQQEVSERDEGWTMAVEGVLQAKEYLHDKGAMSKMLMESVALVV
jgi:hypothetical protein